MHGDLNKNLHLLTKNFDFSRIRGSWVTNGYPSSFMNEYSTQVCILVRYLKDLVKLYGLQEFVYSDFENQDNSVTLA